MSDMPGMSHTRAGLGALGLLPPWLGVVGALVFAAVLVAHLRHVVAGCAAPRRSWHTGHVLMAASMIVMYLPPGLDPVHIAAATWRVLLIVTLGVLMLGAGAELSERRGISALWLLAGTDMLVMLYMWTPGAVSTPLSAVLGLALLGEAGLWSTDRVIALDRPLGPSSSLIPGTGVIELAAHPVTQMAVTRGAPRELRVSMTAMSLGMAYMILAMSVA